MRFMQTLKNKQGIAIESALLFMLVIFFLCTLLITIAITGNHQARIDKMTLLREVEIDQIGEDFLSSVKAGDSFTQAYDNYEYEVSNDMLTVWSKKDETKTPVLYVEAWLAFGELIVNQWSYSLPPQTE